MILSLMEDLEKKKGFNNITFVQDIKFWSSFVLLLPLCRNIQTEETEE